MVNVFYPKISIWEGDSRQIHIFVGNQTHQTSSVLKKIEKGESLDDDDRTTLHSVFGENFKKILFSNENNVPIKFHTKKFLADDTVNLFRKRICHYLNLSSPNDLYIWYEKDISNDSMIYQSFVQHIFKKENKIPYNIFRTYVHNFFHLDLPEDMFNLILKEDAISLLYSHKPTTVYDSLVFQYLYNNYIYFFPTDPHYPVIQDDSVTTYHTNPTLSLIMSNFNAIDDMFHVIIRTDKNDKRVIYFPFGDSNPLVESDKDFIDAIDKIEKEISQVSPLDIKEQNYVNYAQIKGNDQGLNKSINLEPFFQQINATDECPFIKFRTKTNMFYRIHPSSLKQITNEDIDKWTQLSGAKDTRTYILCKLSYYNRSFCTLIIYDDLSYQVKFNFSVKNTENIELVQKYFGKINTYLKSLHDVYPDTLIPLLPQNIFYESREANIIRLSQIIMTNYSTIGHEVKIENIQNLIKTTFYPYFNIIDDKENNILHLQYKKVNNYTKLNNISSFITNNIRLPTEELIQQIMFTFLVTKEDAERELESWKIMHEADGKDGSKSFIKMRYDNFVNVKLRLHSPFEVRYMVNGMTDLQTYDRIRELMNIILTIATTMKRKKQVQEDIVKLVEKGDAIDEIPDLQENVGMDLEGLDEFVEDDIMLDDDILALNKEFEDKMENVKQNINIDDLKEVKKEVKNVDEVEKLKTKGYILSKLIAADSGLFDYTKLTEKEKKRSDYASKCGWVDKRQPVVINKQEKERIEKDYPGSFSGFVKTGSTKELEEKNFYICPKIWCPISRVAMSYEQYDKAGKKCPAYEEKGEQPILFSSKSYFGDGEDGLKVDRYPGFMNKFTHPKEFCLPCCFKKEQKDKCTNKWDGEADDAKGNVQVADIGSEKYIKAETYYPLENNRYGLVPKELQNFLDMPSLGNRHDGTGLISNKVTGILRKGIKQSKQSFLECFASILNNNNIKSSADLIDELQKNLDVKSFISAENGRIMKLFVDPRKNIYDIEEFTKFKTWFLHDHQVNYTKQLSLQTLVKYLQNSTKYEDNHTLSYDILREFMIYSAYNNFKDYLNDDNMIKEHDVLLDLLTNSLQKYINTHNYVPVILEYNIHNNKIVVHCMINKGSESLSNTYTKVPFVFILKRGKYYEPLYLVNNEKNEIQKTQIHYYNKANKSVRKLIQYYITNCSHNKVLHTTEILMIKLANLNYTPKYMVIDYGFKTCGVIVKVNNSFLYIPFANRSNIFFVPNIKYVYIHQVPRFICTLNETEIRKVYKDIEDASNNEFYKINNIINEKDNIIGIEIDKGNVFVPIQAKDRYDITFSQGLFIFLGVEKDDERTDILQDLYNDNETFVKIQKVLHENIDKHPAIKKELEFLQDENNPFPMNFRRDKIMKLLGKILEGVNTNKRSINKVADLLIGNLRKPSNYFVQRIRRFNFKEGEVILSHQEIDKLYDLKIQYENPYKFVMTRIDEMTHNYVTLFDEPEMVFIIPDSAELDVPPIRFKTILKNFNIILSDDRYNPAYLLNIFMQLAKTTIPFNKELYIATLRRFIVNDFTNNNDDFNDFKENPWLKEYLKRNKINEPTLEKYIEIIESPFYYPNIYDIKVMAYLAKLNVVIIGRASEENPDGLHVFYNNSQYYILLSRKFERTKGFNRFDLYCKDNEVLLDKDILGDVFINITEKKQHVFVVQVNEQ